VRGSTGCRLLGSWTSSKPEAPNCQACGRIGDVKTKMKRRRKLERSQGLTFMRLACLANAGARLSAKFEDGAIEVIGNLYGSLKKVKHMEAALMFHLAARIQMDFDLIIKIIIAHLIYSK